MSDREARRRRGDDEGDGPLETRPSRAEIDEEIEHHLRGRVEELVAAGHDRESAEREARRRFGDVARARRETARVYRRRRGLSAAAVATELGGAVRSLLRRPAFAAVAVLLLAIGIGTTTAMLSVIDAYLLRDLPFPHPERLTRLRYVAPEDRTRMPPPPPIEWTEVPEVELAVSWDLDAFTLVGDGRPEQVLSAWVGSDFFPAFGVEPVLGRGFARDETGPDGAAVAIISHDLWQSRFAGDPDVLGRTIRMYASDRPEEAAAVTVVGVLPADFWYFSSYTEVLTPLPGLRTSYVVRLAPGVSREEAAVAMNAAAADAWGPEYSGWGVELFDLHEVHVRGVRPLLGALTAAVGLVLLIACANVAVLMVVQASSRTRELALRSALGAGRARLAMRLLLEAGLLGVAGAVLGVAAAWRGLAAYAPAIERQLGTSVPGGALSLAIDARVAAMSVAATVAVTLLFGLAPLAAGLGRDLAGSLTGSGRSATSSARQRTLRTGLIVVELALSLALLVGAALTVRSSLHLAAVDVGFRPDGVLRAQLGLSSLRYPEPGDWVRRIDQALAGIRETPGTGHVAAAMPGPLDGGNAVPLEPLDGPVAAAGEALDAFARSVTPGYFEVLRMPLLHGRDFAPADRLDGEPVAIVSDRLAQALWPGESALGRSVRVADPMAHGADGPRWHRVVGVVPETREGLADEGQILDVYVPLAQLPRRYVHLLVRSSHPPELLVPVLEDVLWKHDPEQPLTGPELMVGAIHEAGATPRALARVLSGFALFGVLLAVVGVYGVIAFAARQRRRELAVRIALGADRRDVRRLVLGHGARVVGGGLALGLLTAWMMARALGTQLHGVSTADPLTFGAVTLLLGVVALAGVALPARTASSTDPVELLREE